PRIATVEDHLLVITRAPIFDAERLAEVGRMLVDPSRARGASAGAVSLRSMSAPGRLPVPTTGLAVRAAAPCRASALETSLAGGNFDFVYTLAGRSAGVQRLSARELADRRADVRT